MQEQETKTESVEIVTRQIKCLLTLTNDKLITEIEEVISEIGEPDCKLINPCIISDDELIPWLSEVTNQTVLMMSSDKILTLVDPKPQLLKEYNQMFP